MSNGSAWRLAAGSGDYCGAESPSLGFVGLGSARGGIGSGARATGMPFRLVVRGMFPETSSRTAGPVECAPGFWLVRGGRPLLRLSGSVFAYTYKMLASAALQRRILARSRNRAQMRPSGEIARMAHPTQPMATDRVRGLSRTRISPHPSYSGYIGGSTEFYGLQEAKIGHFGGFRRSGNRFEMR